MHITDEKFGQSDVQQPVTVYDGSRPGTSKSHRLLNENTKRSDMPETKSKSMDSNGEKSDSQF